jgi:hypothetical protein
MDLVIVMPVYNESGCVEAVALDDDFGNFHLPNIVS